MTTPTLSPECHAFLLHGTRTGKLATVRADGRPHVVPIWFVLDGDTIVFNTGKKTIKHLNMRRDPRVALCVDEETPLYSYAFLECTAEIIEPDPADNLYWATRIARRYMGDEQAEAYGKRNANPEELLVRLTPTRVLFEQDIAAW